MRNIWFLCSTICFILISCNTQKAVERTALPDYYKIHTSASDNELSIKYFGIGCTQISYKGKSVFTDPAISNPSLFNVVAGKLKTDEALIDLLNPNLDDVQFTIVGHAHYDHLMDLPYLSKNYLPNNSKIIGSKTAQNLLHAANIPQQFIDAAQNSANENSLGNWIYSEDKSIRILPIKANHLPQIANLISLASGSVEQPMKNIPERAKDWLAGLTYNYLIDFLGTENSIEKRVFFQSSTDNGSSGMVDQSYLAEHQIDLAMIAGGINSDDLISNDENLLAEKYLLIHWENFFRSKLLEAKPMSSSHNKLVTFIQEKGWADKVIHPSPGQLINY